MALLTPTPHTDSVDSVADDAGVDPAVGLTGAEAADRLARHGPNVLAEPEPDPAWRRFARQLREPLIVILLVAAAVSLVVTRELVTPAAVAAVVVLNATLGFVQQRRADSALAALRSMVASKARVRRDSQAQVVDVTDLVPGDVVSLEAGDRVPADGRIISAVQMELDESSLTGESVPTNATTAPIAERSGEGLAERSNMAFMQTVVTRGRGEMIVTATAMDTQIGEVADLLRSARSEPTPLQLQLGALARSLALLAGAVVAVVAAVGVLRGQAIEELFLTAVALAVATIPEGLPAVTAVTLAIGVTRMARRQAIVRKLASVETLGATTVICTDKTGTLTRNEMTVRELAIAGVAAEVSGEGYEPVGEIRSSAELDDGALRALLETLVACNDSALAQDQRRGTRVVGDPTEGALLVLGAKAGLDRDAITAATPRLAELPFDSDARYMVTARAPEDDWVELDLKGAPDVLAARSSRVMAADGTELPAADALSVVAAQAERMAASGLRVLAAARRRIPREEFPDGASPAELAELATGVTLLGLVGILDPPRAEARAAVAAARSAGMEVKVLTGDHAETAAAVATAVGVPEGRVVNGSDLEDVADSDLAGELRDISVVARVAPAHKLRIVRALQQSGEVVAMTGDGVNDAPALRQADIGVAMGITGTDVATEAADMVLADDNFATIVSAVERGRAIYANIVKFVRFQLSTALGFATLFLAAAVAGVAGGQPFTPLAILWVNVIMDGPPAMALGVDPPDPQAMTRRPRDRAERILTPRRWGATLFAAAVMAAGTLAVMVTAPGPDPEPGEASVAASMGLTTFVLFQFFNLLNVRSDDRSVFGPATLTNRWLWGALALVVGLQVALTEFGPAQDLFGTAPLSAAQWLACAAVASSVLWAEEARKLVTRMLGRHTPKTSSRS